MDYKNDRFKKFLLFLSAISFLAFVVSSTLLLLRVNEVFGRNDQGLLDIQATRPPEEQRVIDALPESTGYELRRNATEYQIELFDLLIQAQNDFAHDAFPTTGSDVRTEAYASAIVRNFIADFFTLSNKNSRSDVGGLQFFSSELVDDFRSFAIDDFYLYLNQHIDYFGHNALPTVNSTTVLDVRFEPHIIEIDEEDEDLDEFDEATFIYDDFGVLIGREIMTIVIDAEWTYEPSTLWQISQFQTSARFVLIQNEDEVRLYVIEHLPDENEDLEQYGNEISF